jgi:RNA polymerase sigma-70 factor, ECF subfamily
MALRPSEPALDEQLLASALAGNNDSYWQLAEKHRPYLKKLAAMILADRLPSDESDVVSKSLMLACERLAEFRGDENAALLGWLATIVKREALQTLRRTKRLGPLPVGPDGAETLARDSAGPLVHASRREQAARLLAAVEKLPEVYRQIIELHGLEQLAYVSVAERMGRTYADVRQLWSRALKALRKELDSSDER